MSTKTAKPDAFAIAASLNHAASGPHQDNSPAAKPKRKGASSGAGLPATRQGTRLIAGHFPENTHKALRFIIADEGCTLQSLLEEAIHDLLVKKGATKHLNT